MRLDKYLADMQIGSRKEVKGYIKKGWVQVNGITVKQDKYQVQPEADTVSYQGVEVRYQKYFYYMLNKPAGVISATTDKQQKTVIDLLQPTDFRPDLFPVGRLDKDTEGFVLLSNDGELAHELLSPKKHVAKEYFAKVSGVMTKEDVVAFAKGLTLDQGEVALPGKLQILKVDEVKETSEISLVISEGKFHQVKRMVQAVGKKVTYLRRDRIGAVCLDSELKLGDYRPLTKKEIIALSKS
ncbi:pseudouridine synthase [Enterococcus dispar]|uniref:Pseudouridine synthase n=1 Tax=Enterococcus dispar ATCC 51266 TaxID=1139219 RepID=S1NCC7_9ENTE|nr:pseudouridine synthase [Enterococcus dispar]EOT40935.1 16S rRNA pseudouridylate synthase A [Enterococcus dispar ATCC 51266]EOW86692.1 16S rRNA pseudouridylate synthase A [Enterococcus dispar ATCC 51266]MCU7357606.1 rRNA pseudouridine synthase [Enterococcus dispar]MDT2706387.1 pseudouridine synthase [Enterococcus dispar]OJG39634.1 16S rRNA pseudouridylate synthase A [Enterococcus dispar]